MTTRISLLVLVFAVIPVCGCSGRPTIPDPSDPEVGRELLDKALGAWKRDETHEAYKQSEPRVTVIESNWKSGTKLIDYEISPDHSPSGYDVRFKVTLTLPDKSGSPAKQKALYNVCTTPNLVINRAEGSW